MSKRKNDDIYGEKRKREPHRPKRLRDFFERDYDHDYDDYDDDSDIPRSRKVHIDDDDYQEFLEFKRWKKMKKQRKKRHHKGESLLKKLWDIID